MKAPVYRYLRGYSLDPGFSTRLDTAGINEVALSRAVRAAASRDRSASTSRSSTSIRRAAAGTSRWTCRDEQIASQHGLAPSEGNPQFHQQFVYAVAMKTIRHFERALGRQGGVVAAPGAAGERRRTAARAWRRRRRPAAAHLSARDPRRQRLLRSRQDRAARSATSPPPTSSQGANYPGGLVFTCLSPDIVAHEMTHAILDSIHPRYLEDTNPDVAAFHEGFADIVALLQRFTFRRTGGGPAVRRRPGGSIGRRSCSASWRRSSARRWKATAARCAA